MLDSLITNLKTSLIAVSIGFATLLGYSVQPAQVVVNNPVREVIREVVSSPVPTDSDFRLKASTDSSDVRALFTTTLASKITSSATTMTLTSATDKDGNTLASSTYGFILDEGTSVEEFVLADCTATACTNMTRGLSVSTGTTTVSALQFEHRRNASVKITDAPSLIFATNVIRGKQNIDSVLKYSSSIATSTIARNRNAIADWGLVSDTAFTGAGAIKATTGAAGYSQLATALQQASSTSTSGGNPLVIQSGNATSSCSNATTAALNVLVADNSGKLNGNCFPTTITATTTFLAGAGASFSTSTATTTNVGAFPAYWIGKNVKVFTSSGTFTVPSGINKVWVRIIGGGGGGGGNANSVNEGGGGGAGGYAEGWVDITGTTTIGVTIGAGGAGGAGGGSNNGATGGTTYFGTYMNCAGGVGGVTGGAAAGAGDGSAGGVCTGGDINIQGGFGGDGGTDGTNNVVRGQGGAGHFGGSNAYGAGAEGAQGAGAGSNGTAGVAIINW